MPRRGPSATLRWYRSVRAPVPPLEYLAAHRRTIRKSDGKSRSRQLVKASYWCRKESNDMQNKKWRELPHESSSRLSHDDVVVGGACLRPERCACGTDRSAQVANPDRAGKGDRERLQKIAGQYSRSTRGGSLGRRTSCRGAEGSRQGAHRKENQSEQHDKIDADVFGHARKREA